VNREERLRALAPGARPDLIEALAALPAGTVRDVLAYGRQTGRDRLVAEKNRKRNNREQARRHGHYDEDQLTDRTLAVLDSALARSLAGRLDALEALALFVLHVNTLIPGVVRALRPSVADAALADALGLTVQALHKRYGPRPENMPEPASACPVCGAADPGGTHYRREHHPDGPGRERAADYVRARLAAVADSTRLKGR